MTTEDRAMTTLLDMILDALDIPKSLYDKATARHKSLGEWLCRSESTVAQFKPHVSPQGSFRYGTVNRPLLVTEEYDLDNVTVLTIQKSAMSQKALKELYGNEIKAYAEAHGMVTPVEEKNRCWRLRYADEVKFHFDTVPCVVEEEKIIVALISAGVLPHLAARAVAITDRRHPYYKIITSGWPSSNPRGFAAWFVDRVRPYAIERIRQLVQGRFYASVEDVPPYEWKTTLQRVIQLLKRHRDVMFRDNQELKPISMIITNLAAHAYAGESDLWFALRNAVENMPRYVNSIRPRVPNPADPKEDYADKWVNNPSLEDNFWAWHAQVSADLKNLPSMLKSNDASSTIRRMFHVDLFESQLRELESLARPAVAPAIARSTPVVTISNPPRPWRDRK